MTIKVVKTSTDYEAALAEIDALMDLDPDVGTVEADRLELLTVLVQQYEAQHAYIEMPDPIAAIEFRMEQQDLAPRDLVPYLGSRSKVSEVLARKRPLTLSMIRALSAGLGIPAEVLLQETEPPTEEQEEIQWDRFPLKEMVLRHWVDAEPEEVRECPERVGRRFFASLGSSALKAAFLRRTRHVRAARAMDEYALTAWAARVVVRASEEPDLPPYKPGTVSGDFMRQVVQLSPSDQGPRLARDFLRAHGIVLVIEPHLPHTYLDGAAILVDAGRPVIALTLRHDRIDNFWFTLTHELAHIALHFSQDTTFFYDDLEVDSDATYDDDPREREADQLAGEILIPEDAWRKSPASHLRSSNAAQHLATKLHIHPAIVAGRMRHDFNAYRLLNNVVGHGEVRKHFPETEWS